MIGKMSHQWLREMREIAMFVFYPKLMFMVGKQL